LSTSSRPLGQPAQAEQDEDRGDDLDQKLRHRQIGCREPDEGDAGDDAGATHQDEGREAVILGLIGAPSAQAMPIAQIAAKTGSMPASVGSSRLKPA
jgi:hypothetical protein